MRNYSDKEVSLGRQMATEIESTQKTIADPEVLAFANRVLKSLSRQEFLRMPLELEVIDNPRLLIASALPGGILLLRSGAILHADTEAELAGLLAHAMGHAQTGRVNRPAQAAGNSIPLIFFGGQWGNCERSMDGTRSPRLRESRVAQATLIESQADILGLGYMINGGYEPQALVSVFEHWGGQLSPDEELRATSDSLTKVAAGMVVNTSAFDGMRARLASLSPSRRQLPTLYN